MDLNAFDGHWLVVWFLKMSRETNLALALVLIEVNLIVQAPHNSTLKSDHQDCNSMRPAI